MSHVLKRVLPDFPSEDAVDLCFTFILGSCEVFGQPPPVSGRPTGGGLQSVAIQWPIFLGGLSRLVSFSGRTESGLVFRSDLSPV